MAIYGGAIRWLVDMTLGEDREAGTIFVEAVDQDIPLRVQAGIVEDLEPFATIRFIDDFEEALDTHEPGDPVRGGGALLALGVVTATASDQVRLYAGRYLDIGQVVAYELELQRGNDRWYVTGSAGAAVRRRS